MSSDAAARLYPGELDEWRSYNAVAAVPEADLGHLLSIHEAGHHPAVITDDEVITYSELRSRASAWANRLQELGLEQGARVGVLASRDAGCYPLIYACLLAGYTYVPLDENAYGAGVCALASRARARVIVGSDRQIERLKDALAEFTTLSLGDVTLADEPKHAIVSAPPDDLAAYVIYTSGTTGRPKGVAVSRKSIANLASWHQERHDIAPGDRLSQNAPLVFDPSAQQIVAAWISGASLYVVPEDVRVDPERLVRWLGQHRITHLDAVTAHWASLTQVVIGDAGAPMLPDLRWSVIAGESMYGSQARAWLQGLGRGSRLDNIYGPTEATVNATQHEVHPDVADGRVPIGSPLPGYQVYVLDEDGELCPPGVTGEIFVAGIGVALGYDDDPDKTNEHFRHILVDGAFERAYRTGDLAELRADGPGGPTLIFVGRRDRQAKVSGIRVELDHVETVVASIPGVVQAVALVRGEAASAVTIAFTGTTRVDAVRSAMSSRLPRHIRIGAVHGLETIPLTASGKVDEKALGDLLGRDRISLRGAVAEVEQSEDESVKLLSKVRASWSRELDQPVSSDVAFSALGGTSLVAFRIVARLRSLSLPVDGADFMSDPTPRSMTAAVIARGGSVEQLRADIQGREITPERRVGVPVVPIGVLEAVWSDAAPVVGTSPRLGPLAEAWTDHRTPAMGTATIEVELEADTYLILQAVARVLDAHPSLRTSWPSSGRPSLHESPRSIPVVAAETGDETLILVGVRNAAGISCMETGTTRVAIIRSEASGLHVVMIVAPHAVVDSDLADRVKHMLLDEIHLSSRPAQPGDLDSWWRNIEHLAEGRRLDLRRQWSSFDELDAAVSKALHDPTAPLARHTVSVPAWEGSRGGQVDSSARWGVILESVVAALAHTGLGSIPVSIMGRPSMTLVVAPVEYALIDAVPLLLPDTSSASEAAELLSSTVGRFPHWIAGAVSIRQPSTALARQGIAFVGAIRVQRRIVEEDTDSRPPDVTSGEPRKAPWIEITDHVIQGRLEIVASGVGTRVVDEIVKGLAERSAADERGVSP